jgi:hypothetical protein
MPGTRDRPQEQEVELTGFLAEFRTALREEFEAARRVAASAGIQLLNGRLIGQAAGAYQYAFTLESALNLPDDMPGEPRVRGRGRRCRLEQRRRRKLAAR